MRTTRSNSGLAEELLPSNLERECNEEACRYEEVRETGLSEDQAEQFFLKQTLPCSFDNTCVTENTQNCINGWGIYFCECKDGFFGSRCEFDKFADVQIQEATTEPQPTTQTFEQTISDNILIPEPLESDKLELITSKIEEPVERDQEVSDDELEERRGLIRQQLDRLNDLYELISMMRSSAKEESTERSIKYVVL